MTAKAKRERRTAFRARISAELSRMGFPAGSWHFQDHPANLMVWLDGRLRFFRINAGISKAELARQMGRLEGWAEALGLEPQSEPRRAYVNGGAHAAQA